jgi:hypothetical protein
VIDYEKESERQISIVQYGAKRYRSGVPTGLGRIGR